MNEANPKSNFRSIDLDVKNTYIDKVYLKKALVKIKIAQDRYNL